ncbi:MAG TPA: hypothetical protein PLY87_17330, partial [Planctomycetaceae bacterium]|nr:hypothetical protein [Planctomycetaceae bacterium]HQZ66860.1 hypothetical protein [Planctomycetaceae bacterium]
RGSSDLFLDRDLALQRAVAKKPLVVSTAPSKRDFLTNPSCTSIQGTIGTIALHCDDDFISGT